DLWAYQPISRPPIPQIRNPQSAIRNPIDAFLLEKLRAAGIDSFAPAAYARSPLRRLTFDLTGLPPTPEELKEFLAVPPSLLPSVSPSANQDRETERQSDAGKAIKAAIARLLASPHYGERQAQHWLDVV